MRKPKRLIKLEAEAKAKGVSVQKLLEDDLEKHLGKFASIGGRRLEKAKCYNCNTGHRKSETQSRSDQAGAVFIFSLTATVRGSRFNASHLDFGTWKRPSLKDGGLFIP